MTPPLVGSHCRRGLILPLLLVIAGSSFAPPVAKAETLALESMSELAAVKLPASDCDGTFKLQDAPSPGRFASLSDISFASPSSGWAVGRFHTRDGDVWIKPLILHWDGETWTRQHVDLGKNAYLNGVVALAEDDVWAAGSILAPYNKPLILHWNGSRWTRQESPANFVPGRENAHLFAIDGTASGETWSVGSVHEEKQFSDGSVSVGGVRSRPLVLRRDGASWNRSAVPEMKGRHIGLWDLHVQDEVDVWTVGGKGPDPFSPDKTIALHWDGTGWKRVKTPNPADEGNSFNGIDGTSVDSVWAVGSSGPDKTSRSLAVHWDGTRWATVPTPDSSRTNGLSDVSATTYGTYAAGSGGRWMRRTKPLVMQWTGSEWQVLNTAVPTFGSDHKLFGVEATEDDVWAVGGSFSDTGRAEVIIERSCSPVADPGPAPRPHPR